MYAEPKELLVKLGGFVKATRRLRRMNAARLAADANISRTTLYLIENGDPSVAAGSYMQVLFLLGIAQQIHLGRGLFSRRV